MTTIPLATCTLLLCLTVIGSNDVRAQAVSPITSESRFDIVLKPEPTPKHMRGLWAASAEDCLDEYADTRMAIGPNWISMYEIHGLLQLSDTWSGGSSDEIFLARYDATGGRSFWILDLAFKWNSKKPNELRETVLRADDIKYDDQDETVFVRCES